MRKIQLAMSAGITALAVALSPVAAAQSSLGSSSFAPIGGASLGGGPSFGNADLSVYEHSQPLNTLYRTGYGAGGVGRWKSVAINGEGYPHAITVHDTGKGYADLKGQYDAIGGTFAIHDQSLGTQKGILTVFFDDVKVREYTVTKGESVDVALKTPGVRYVTFNFSGFDAAGRPGAVDWYDLTFANAQAYK